MADAVAVLGRSKSVRVFVAQTLRELEAADDDTYTDRYRVLIYGAKCWQTSSGTAIEDRVTALEEQLEATRAETLALERGAEMRSPVRQSVGLLEPQP